MASIGKKVKEFFTKSKEAEKEEAEQREENISIQFELNDEKKKEIVDRIKLMKQDFGASRGEFMRIREEGIRQYEGIKDPPSEPWRSNISTMVTTVACDLLHSKLFGMVWNEKSLYWEGTEEHDIEVAFANKIVMSWVVHNDIKAQNLVDDLCHMLVVDGTIAIKKVWRPYWVWIKRKVPPKEITYDMVITGKIRYSYEYDYIRREKLFLELRPLENVYFAYNVDTTQSNWEDTADILDERWYTIDDLKELKEDGAIDPDVNLETLKAKMDILPEFKGTEKQRMEAEGTVPVNTRKEAHALKCIEAEMMYDINDDNRREKCVFLIVEDLDLYLSGKAIQNVSRIGRSSWLIRPFLRRPGRAYGKSIPELVRHLHKELDHIHNSRLDAVDMRVAGFFFYRPATGMSPRRIIVGPNMGIPVDDPQRDISYPTLPSGNIAVSFQEERLVMELIERLTYLTPAQLGRETAERPTARGTLAVINMGEQKFSLIGRRVQAIVCDLLTDVRQKYEENMPPAKWERIMGREKLKDYPSVESMMGSFDAKMQLDLTAADPDMDRQLSVVMFQSMAFDPLVMQNPVFMWEVRADYLRAMRRVPVEKYIGPRPQTEMSTKDADDLFTLCEQEMVNIDLSGVDPATMLPRLMELKRTERYANFTPEAKARFNDVVRKLQTGYIDRIQKGVEQFGQIGKGVGGATGFGASPGMGGLKPGSSGPLGAGAMPQGTAGAGYEGMPAGE